MHIKICLQLRTNLWLDKTFNYFPNSKIKFKIINFIIFSVIIKMLLSSSCENVEVLELNFMVIITCNKSMFNVWHNIIQGSVEMK